MQNRKIILCIQCNSYVTQRNFTLTKNVDMPVEIRIIIISALKAHEYINDE